MCCRNYTDLKPKFAKKGEQKFLWFLHNIFAIQRDPEKFNNFENLSQRENRDVLIFLTHNTSFRKDTTINQIRQQ